MPEQPSPRKKFELAPQPHDHILAKPEQNAVKKADKQKKPAVMHNCPFGDIAALQVIGEIAEHFGKIRLRNIRDGNEQYGHNIKIPVLFEIAREQTRRFQRRFQMETLPVKLVFRHNFILYFGILNISSALTQR